MKLLACLLLLCGTGLQPVAWQAKPPAPPQPNRDARQQTPEYLGPGREVPAPRDVREVKIGYFGPADPLHPVGGTLWQGAAQAIEEANREGGYKGLPFRLVPAWADNPWTAGAGLLVRLIYQGRVWALIGSIDGASTHLAEQIALKARLTLINPAASDRTIHGANVPWMFSCVPGDHRQGPVLVKALAGRPFVLVSATDHDSRAFVGELRATPPLPAQRAPGRGSVTGTEAAGRAASVSERSAPTSHIEFQAGTPEVSALAARVAEAAPQAVVVIAGARDSGRVVAALRRLGCRAPVLCGPAAGRRAFLEEAGAAAEGVLFPLLMETSGGALPDYAAAHAYDAARLLVAAIRQAGLNRARIRDAVRALSGWQGRSGVIRWDALGQNERAVRLGIIRQGRAVPVENQVSLGAMPSAFILR